DPPQGLGMPLHAQYEAAAGYGNRLDQTIFGPGLDTKPGSEPVDGLVVQGIDQEGRDTALNPGKEAAGFGRYRMGMAEAFFPGQAGIVAMIHHARHLVDMLVQTAAQGDVQLLMAAADCK